MRSNLSAPLLVLFLLGFLVGYFCPPEMKAITGISFGVVILIGGLSWLKKLR